MRKMKNYTQADVRDWAMWTYAAMVVFFVIEMLAFFLK